MRAGDTFRFADPGPPIVVVIVSASTKNLGLELPIIEPGEHPSLGQRSYVRCDRARLVAARLLEENLQRGTIRLSQPLAPALLARITDAVRTSSHTPNEVRAALEPTR